MSEAELHVLKTRMLEGRRAKARRGELFFNLPRGYVRSHAGEIVFDSDEQVQATVRLVFGTFERRRTINGVLAHFVAHDIQLPLRVRTGAAKGELEWHAPNRFTLSVSVPPASSADRAVENSPVWRGGSPVSPALWGAARP